MTTAEAWESAGLIAALIRRDIAGRYRGSMLGLLWSLLTPLVMLAIYTVVFGVVLRARWSIPGAESAEHSTAEFAVILFSGLLVFQLFAELVTAAPSLIVANANYVKKIIFPVQILPIVAAGSALFHAGVSLFVLVIVSLFVFRGVPSTILLAPLALAPLAVLVIGIAWFLAALGVYFRDLSQFISPVVTATLFLSPIFFPRTAMPGWLQPWMNLNPITVPVECFRGVAIFGTHPDWMALGVYSIAAFAIACLGLQFFQRTRVGFADVL